MPIAPNPTDSLEVKLAFQTIACRTCSFFWPKDGRAQPYGPYSTFDFNSNYPVSTAPLMESAITFPWIDGDTSAPAFPSPEIMDGCRKAPIMTIGINPNLTSYYPGPTGASWSYPGFQSDNGTDATIKYAWYYRYRSIYQEHFDLAFIKPYLLTAGQVVAANDGKVGLVKVNGTTPPIELNLLYNGDSQATTISLTWTDGNPPFVVLLNTGSTFKKGDLIAAKLDVSAGKNVTIDRQVVGYYNQFVPVLNYFNQFLISKGIQAPDVRMGEDVCQLDMVACASPHWAPPFLGGSVKSENDVINNCVSDNSWVIKQLVQTRPAILYIVGESSYNMFRDILGNLIKCNVALPDKPEDGAFTLLRKTLDASNPVTLDYSYSNAGTTYSLSTRLVISPHFSFNYNFTPQFRFGPVDTKTLENSHPDCYHYLQTAPNISIGLKMPGDIFTAFLINSNVAQTLSDIKASYSSAYGFLQANYYDPHAMLATVLADMYDNSTIGWINAIGGAPGYLARNEGACNFCVNDHWTFPLGCPYQKDKLAQPAPGFLEQITSDMLNRGKPGLKIGLRSYAEKLVMTPDGKIII